MSQNILNYINRTDKQKSFESDIIQWINNDNVAILGFPGVGKSASAKAIAAKYIITHNKEKPAVILSISRTKKPNHLIELVRINEILIPIPIVMVPFASTKEEEVLKEFVNSINSFEKFLKKLNEMVISLSSKLDYTKDIDKVREILTNILDPKLIPSQFTEIIDFAKVISDSIPYISAALNISKKIFELLRNRKTEKLEQRDTLIVIDDVADLGKNWEILSRITDYNFHYLFVIRVGPQEYLSMLRDPTYSNIYLKNSGLPITVQRSIVIPPPTFEIFTRIMQSHNVNQKKNIQNLWNYTGGIPAVALMMSQETNTDKDLENILKRVHTDINNDTIIPTWDSNHAEKRLAFTFYSVKEIYQDLKKKNLAYVALCCQPDGVGIEEITIFCGLSTHQIYTFGNQKVEEIYQKIKIDFESEYKNVRLDTHPHNGLEEYDFILDRTKEYRKIVEKIIEPWDAFNVSRNMNDKFYEDAFSIITENEGHLVYKFNSLFQHIPILLKEAEKVDVDLHKDLDATRERLLKAIEQLMICYRVIPNTRILHSAFEHIDKIQDLRNVQGAVTILMSRMYSDVTFLYEGRYFDLINIRPKIMKSVIGNDLYIARLLLALSKFASNISPLDNEFANNLTDYIFEIFEYLNLKDRRILLLFCHSLLTLRYVYNKGNLFQPLQMEEAVNQICYSKEDLICLLARTSILPDITAMYVTEQSKNHCEYIFTLVEDAIQKLENSDLSQLTKLMYLESSHSDLWQFKARLNELMGSYYWRNGNLKLAAEKHSKAIDGFEKLSLEDYKVSNMDLLLMVKLLDSQKDEEFKSTLESISYLENKEQNNINFLNLSPKILVNIYTHAYLARIALNNLYKRNDSLGGLFNQVPKLNEFVKIDQSSLIRTYVASRCMEQLIHKNIDFKEFVTELLQYLSSLQITKNISNLTNLLLQMIKENKHNITNANTIDGTTTTYTIQDLSKKLISILDDPNKQLEGNIDLVNCKIYRDGTYIGLLKESICYMTFMLGNYSKDIVTNFSIHLFFNNYQHCIYILSRLSTLSNVPIIHQLYNKLIKAINTYINETPEKATSTREIVKTYLQFYFCLQ